jgi:hypothetical protein
MMLKQLGGGTSMHQSLCLLCANAFDRTFRHRCCVFTHAFSYALCPCAGRKAATIAAMMLNTKETKNARCKPERKGGIADENAPIPPPVMNTCWIALNGI